jgi:lipopolysaccharide assembly protein A
MSLLKSLLALLFVLLGIVFGAMNRDVMPIDLFFTQLEASIGLTVLLVLLLGCLLGGSVVLATVVWPLRSELAKAEKDAKAQDMRNKDTGHPENKLMEGNTAP